MDPIRFTRPRSRQTVGAPGPLMPATARRCYTPSLFCPLFDPATKWLGQGKAFEYAQQNVNLNRVSRRPQARPKQALASPHGEASEEVLEGGAPGRATAAFRHALPPYRRRKRAQKRAHFTSQRAYPQIGSRNRRKLDCVRKTGFHFATKREEDAHARPPEA